MVRRYGRIFVLRAPPFTLPALGVHMLPRYKQHAQCPCLTFTQPLSQKFNMLHLTVATSAPSYQLCCWSGAVGVPGHTQGVCHLHHDQTWGAEDAD